MVDEVRLEDSIKEDDMGGDSYATPNWIKELFEGWFDPCRISNGELRDFDGLGMNWLHKTFVNPPYSKPLPWVEKAVEENRKGKTIALLLKLDCSTKWFLKLVDAKAHIILINERVKFNGKPPAFPSMIAILEGSLNTRTDKLIAEGKQKVLFTS